MRIPTTDFTLYDKGVSQLPNAMAQMGYASLREGQSEPIHNIMLQRDTMCILPTGAGKTALHVLPTLAMQWRTIVFSPLVALMRDQVQSMQRAGISAGCVNSSQSDAMNYQALQDWQQGRLQIIMVAPERIQNEMFDMAMTNVPADMVVVDEAHVMSQWSNAFRPSYKLCGDFVARYNPKVVVALTATATTQVVDDVTEILGIKEATICRYYPPRTNLKLKSLLVDDADMETALLQAVRSVNGSTIVYCQTVKDVTKYVQFLSQCGESVTFYHGQITEQTQKSRNQDEFMSGRARICVCTNAFGMGIDKPDIEAVIHTGPPTSIEAVSQEVGRAARDGRDAQCIMLVSPGSRWMQNFFLTMSHPDGNEVAAVYRTLQQVANHHSMAHITGKDLGEKSGVKAADAALGFLEAHGCVKRIQSSDAVYNITVLDAAKATSNQLAYLNAIQEGGVETKDDEGLSTYGIDINWLIARLSKAKATIDTNLRAMQKAGVLMYTLPFRGKATQLIQAPSVELIRLADERFRMEAQKLKDVQSYIDTPDAQKHSYLQQYFALA